MANYKHEIRDHSCVRCGNYVFPDEAHKYCFAGDLERAEELRVDTYDPLRLRSFKHANDRLFENKCPECYAFKSAYPDRPNMINRIVAFGGAEEHWTSCTCVCHAAVVRDVIIDSICASLRARARQNMVAR